MTVSVVRVPSRSPWPLAFLVDDDPADVTAGVWGEVAQVVQAELDRRHAADEARGEAPPRCPPPPG